MFQITKYLQYKNTPDGKPRVLVEGVDYWIKTESALCTYDTIKHIALLSDCRPLLSVEIDGKVWTEGDICTYNQELFTDIGGSYSPQRFVEKFGFVVFDGYQMNFELYSKMFHLSNGKQKLCSFFDDPAKYSQLLWGCGVEEGWKRIFELLDITFDQK